MAKPGLGEMRMSTEDKRAWDAQPIENLMKYIVEKHHAFCRKQVECLDALIDELLKKHGDKHPGLYRIKTVFTSLRTDLIMHLVKEEQTLFPYISRLEQAVARKEAFPRPPYGTVANPIRFMVLEHGTSYAQLKEISEISQKLEGPPGADAVCHTLCASLGEFEADMEEHTVLEDDIIFPRAIALERAADSFSRQHEEGEGTV